MKKILTAIFLSSYCCFASETLEICDDASHHSALFSQVFDSTFDLKSNLFRIASFNVKNKVRIDTVDISTLRNTDSFFFDTTTVCSYLGFISINELLSVEGERIFVYDLKAKKKKLIRTVTGNFVPSQTKRDIYENIVSFMFVDRNTEELAGFFYESGKLISFEKQNSQFAIVDDGSKKYKITDKGSSSSIEMVLQILTLPNFPASIGSSPSLFLKKGQHWIIQDDGRVKLAYCSNDSWKELEVKFPFYEDPYGFTSEMIGENLYVSGLTPKSLDILRFYDFPNDWEYYKFPLEKAFNAQLFFVKDEIAYISYFQNVNSNIKANNIFGLELSDSFESDAYKLVLEKIDLRKILTKVTKGE